MIDRQPEVDIAFINAKARIAIVLAIGGMLSLVVGLFVLLFGTSAQNSAVFKFSSMEINASGIGAVIMATSVMWAYLAGRIMHMHSGALLMKKMPPSIFYWMSEWPKLQIPYWITSTRLICINVCIIFMPGQNYFPVHYQT